MNIPLYPLNHSIHHNFTNRQFSSRFSHKTRPQTQHLTTMASVVNVSPCHHMNVVNQRTISQTCSCNVTVIVSTSIRKYTSIWNMFGIWGHPDEIYKIFSVDLRIFDVVSSLEVPLKCPHTLCAFKDSILHTSTIRALLGSTKLV